MPRIHWNGTSYELVYGEDETSTTAEFVATEDAPDAAPEMCTCESCKAIRRDPTAKLKRGVVHNYSYAPRRWTRRSVENDPDNFAFGIELETDAHQQDRSGGMRYSALDAQQAVDMRRPKRLWIAKTDSSVTGPEFVSHPATLAYWKAHAGELADMFKMLVHAGYRSHDNDNCGMHINISRNAFEDAGHLYKFLTLLHYSPAWSLRMSQRTASSASQWAPLTSVATASARRRIAERAFNPMERYAAVTHKYSALNIPAASQGRVEFRLPRGTLRLDRFMKNLEWTHAMVQYTRDQMDEVLCTPDKFMEFVESVDNQYPNLVAFINERKDRLNRALARTIEADALEA